MHASETTKEALSDDDDDGSKVLNQTNLTDFFYRKGKEDV